MSGTVIRPATLRDAAHLVSLFDIGGRGLPLYLWNLDTTPGQSPLEVARAEVLSEVRGISFRTAWFAEIDGDIAGLLMGYPVTEPIDIESLPPTLRPIMELENASMGYWFVNMLAVYPEFRGHGLGSMFLAHADAMGRETEAMGTALVVDSYNTGARRLYERAGYRFADRRPVVPFPGHPPGGEFALMVKPNG